MPLTRRQFGSATAVAAMRGLAAPAAQHPNIIILLADDLGPRDVSYAGGEIPTPNIDHLAGEGVRFANFYCFPLCSPSRSALLTGRNPIRFGMALSVIRPWSSYGVPMGEHLMPQSLKSAGYQTWILGKWHLGHAHRGMCPNARGFDEFYGFLNAGIDYFSHISYGGLDWQRNGESVREQGYSTELLGAEAVRRVRQRDRNRPFFLYLPFNAPHTPLSAPRNYLEKFGQFTNPARRTYAAAMSCLDEQVGRLAAVLKEEGIDRNTIVLFLGDNGAPRAGGNALPYRGWKGSVSEGGLRVPAFLRWPGVLASSQCELVASVFDIFPTLASAAQITPQGKQPLDGANLWPAIVKGETVERNPLFFGVKKNENADREFALLDDGWKLIEETDASGAVLKSSFFDLQHDPLEKNDLAAGEAGRVKRLAEAMGNWKRLNPPADIDSSMHPHPGWAPPIDYAAATPSYAIAPDTKPEI